LGYLYILPWVIGFLFLTLGPMLVSLYLSFSKYSIIVPPSWIGWGNYVRAFTEDELFSRSIWNTFYYVIFAVPLGLTLSLTLALLLDQGATGDPHLPHSLFSPVHHARGGIDLALALALSARRGSDQLWPIVAWRRRAQVAG
jgi:ABC-type sugar transport system permease subunit